MAHKMQAVSKLAPQVVSAGPIHDDEFIKDITDDTGMSEGEALQAKRTIVRRLGRHLARGRTVHLDDLGTFSVDIDLTGRFTIHFKADPDLTDYVHANFSGQLANADNIGKKMPDLIAQWNADPANATDQIPTS